LYAGKNMICRQGKSPAGNSIDGVIGDRDTRGASLRLTSGDDTPQALLGALSSREGVKLVYAPALSLRGPAEAVMQGTSHTASGWQERSAAAKDRRNRADRMQLRKATCDESA
jgi:hypothetical protein